MLVSLASADAYNLIWCILRPKDAQVEQLRAEYVLRSRCDGVS